MDSEPRIKESKLELGLVL